LSTLLRAMERQVLPGRPIALCQLRGDAMPASLLPEIPVPPVSLAIGAHHRP
jgi:hypothetical protein